MKMTKMIATGMMMGAAAISSAQAAEVIVNSDIATSTTWTADNTYNLQTQIYVRPGATLTIEAGTIVASTPSANGAGSLAVTRGGKIMVLGTEDKPVIMTSTNDVATWAGSNVVGGSVVDAGDPTTGTWREAANEWGNLTIMGRGYISENATAGNTATPSATNVAAMEGLVQQFEGDPDVLYGGGDDEDDSGCIQYLSIRYGGRVVGLNNELNGLSLGGIGRATDISHVEIMNNVDDGVEVWGGTVNLKYLSIWNIGDDSLDIDQGYRGKVQFVFIVQGYSLDAGQGSGVGDNAIEIDGAENSDWQPVTTTTIYNATVIGQPLDGDGLTAWRDNARVQYRQSIFMDGGEALVRFDNVDGDGAQGYGFNGTLSWANTWTTPYTVTSTVNAPANPGDFYNAQSAGNASGQGFLAEITDSVFFRNLAGAAYTESDARGVTVAGGSNPAKANVVAPFDGVTNANMPVVSLTRAAPVSKGGKQMLRVTSVDPRAANDAVSSEGTPDPNCPFFTQVQYRGAFSPFNNWLLGWTAADAFGMTVSPGNEVDPASTLELKLTTISFQSKINVIYTIECSTDGKIWTPVETLTGDGSLLTVADELGGDFDGSKLYRVIVQ